MIHSGNLSGRGPLGLKAPKLAKDAGRAHMATVPRGGSHRNAHGVLT